MSEHRKLLVARAIQGIFYVGTVGFLVEVLGTGFVAAQGSWAGLLLAPFATAMAAGLTMTLSPFLLTCAGCGAPYFDVLLDRLSFSFARRLKVVAVMWKPVPNSCPSCGMDRS